MMSLFLTLCSSPVLAAAPLEIASDGDTTGAAVRMLVALTALAILPGLLLVMTPFTRFIIVLSMMRQALGLQQSPPNQILIGLAVVLTMVSMRPTLEVVQKDALDPYMASEITAVEAYDGFIAPMRTFMFRNTNRDDLRTAMRIGRLKTRPKSLEDIPTTSVITGFVLSELRTAFTIAIKVYLPFLVVDIVVASVLLGMGMMMLPPVVISLPFKLMVFVLMDGWGLLVVGLVEGVH